MTESTNGDHRIRVYHWWPGRQFAGANPIPDWYLYHAEQRGSRYLTVAAIEVNGHRVTRAAYCCPKDSPSRARGRHIAVARLLTDLDDMERAGL